MWTSHGGPSVDQKTAQNTAILLSAVILLVPLSTAMSWWHFRRRKQARQVYAAMTNCECGHLIIQHDTNFFLTYPCEVKFCLCRQNYDEKYRPIS